MLCTAFSTFSFLICFDNRKEKYLPKKKKKKKETLQKKMLESILTFQKWTKKMSIFQKLKDFTEMLFFKKNKKWVVSIMV